MTTLGFDPRLATPTAPDLTGAAATLNPAAAGKAREQAEDFEAMYLSSMFQNMLSGIAGDGPLGGTQALAPWRSFLTQEYGKIVAKAGGVGLADHVYRSLIEYQAARTQ